MILGYQDIRISGNLDTEILTYWDIGISEYWVILRYWDIKYKILEYWDIGILGS